MVSLDDVLNAVKVGETTDWEFKSARGGFPGSFWSSYSAMANSEGGFIVLGVKETKDGALLDGLDDAQVATFKKTLWDGVNNRATVSVNLLTESDVDAIAVDASKLLSVRIPRATRSQRPVFLGPVPFGNTYRRIHEGDYRCDDGEVRRMLADADPTPADQRLLDGFTLEDLDHASLTQYRQRLRAAKGEHPWLQLDDRELLRNLGCWRRERGSDREGLTLAGLLMFGKDAAIREPDGAPEYFVDYREKLDPSTRWTDRIYPDGTWEANLLQFYQRVWPKLASGLAVPFRLEDGVRRDVTRAHEALREAFVNALIHGDYSAPGGVVIERYPDHFVMENPGTLLVSIEQYLRGGVSECRNKAIQKAFLMIGGGEQAGSGVDKIRSGWKEQHWRTPQISTRTQPDRVRLTLTMLSLIPETTLANLRRRFASHMDTLSPSELQALATAELEGSVSNVRLQELLADHSFDITRMLHRLCEQGLLISDNRRRWTTYRLADQGRVTELFGTEPLSGADPASLGKDSPDLGKDSAPLGKDSSTLGKESGPLSGDSSPSPTLPLGGDWKEGIGEDEAELRRIAEPVASRGRAPRDLTRSTILQLCAWRYLSAEDLGSLLKRYPAKLQADFLSPMVANGDLQLRHPNAPNRPGQAYATAEHKP